MILTQKDSSLALITFRIRHGLTQDQLSKKTGVSIPTIIGIEKDKNTPHAETLFKLNEFIKTFENE
jgi:transcriptional regulator with XRE-family HTH domain